MSAATDKGLFLPLPVDKLPNLAKLIPGSHNEMFVAYWYFPTAHRLSARSGAGGKVTAWSDIFQPAFKNA